MEMLEAIQSALDGSAILFAGSGFSYGAKNVASEGLPVGTKLRDLLAKECGFTNVTYGLGRMADFYKKKHSVDDLIGFIRTQCTNVSHEKYHETIMSIPWRRIYTTNYDKVIENAALSNKTIITPITYFDNFKDSAKNDICVHINGFIDRLNAKTINNEFRLTDYSYNCDTLVENDWYGLMVDDFNSVKCIIVIGFSMEFDVDITRLFSIPDIKKKVIFISSPTTDEISLSTFEDYGHCYPIGVEQFGTEIATAAKDFIPSNQMDFRSFDYKYRASYTTIKPTYEEINRFYMIGEISEKLYVKSFSREYLYVINRKAVELASRHLFSKKILLAVSDLGGGKTVFCDILERELASSEVDVFIFRHRYNNIDDEIIDICNRKRKCVVLIDNYQGHLDILRKFYNNGIQNITFVLTARYAINNTTYRKLCRTLNLDVSDVFPLYLSFLNKQEKEDLSNVMIQQSLVGQRESDIMQTIEERCNNSFAPLLLYFFNSSKIKGELIDLYKTINSNTHNKLREVAIFLLIQSISNISLDLFELLDLLSANYLDFEKSSSEFLSEIFDFSSRGATAKSSIIAQELIRNAIPISDVIDVLIKVFLAADKRNGITYEELKKSIVSHSQFIRFINYNISDNKAFTEIERFYDSIRHSNFAKTNPLFWEQFASAYLDMKNFPMAKRCLDVSLQIAKELDWFVPYQVKTVYARYHIENCINELNINVVDPETAIHTIITSTTCLLEHYNAPDNNVYYVFKVAAKYPNIFNEFRSKFDPRQNSIYIEQVMKIVAKMRDYIDLNKDNDLYNGAIQKWQKELLESTEFAKRGMAQN